MTKIKLCGLTRECDIEAANEIMPDYIGFVFFEKSRRFVPPEKAAVLKAMLKAEISAVGVFVDESVGRVTELLERGIIDMAQLHGHEDGEYIRELRSLTGKAIIKAFRIDSEADIRAARECGADYVLLDSGEGSGKLFDWRLIRSLERPYFLAGGLDCSNVAEAVTCLGPFAVDVSSGIETGGLKDAEKMKKFAGEVRRADKLM